MKAALIPVVEVLFYVGRDAGFRARLRWTGRDGKQRSHLIKTKYMGSTGIRLVRALASTMLGEEPESAEN